MQRVLEEDVEDSIEVGPRAQERRAVRGGRFECERDALRVGVAPPTGERRLRRLAGIDRLRLGVALARAAQHEELVDRAREAVDLPRPLLELARGGVRQTGSLRLLETQAQTRKRGPELVGCVGDELALGGK